MTPHQSSAVVDGVDVDAVHAVLGATPGVTRIGGSAPGSLTTYLPGRSVPGVRITPAAVEVEIVAGWERPVPAVARDVQQRLAGLVAGRAVHVTVTDLESPDPTPSPESEAQ